MDEKTQKLLRISHIREAHLTVRRLHFQLSDFFGHFTSFLLKFACHLLLAISVGDNLSPFDFLLP